MRDDNTVNSFNKQVNFYIIRSFYDALNGYVTNEDDSLNLYKILGISRSSYDSIVRDGNEGYIIDLKKAQMLEEITGIEYRIFLGEKYFTLKELNIDNVMDYITARNNVKNGIDVKNNEEKAAIFKEEVSKKLHELSRYNIDSGDQNFSALYTFAKTKISYKKIDITKIYISKAMSRFNNFEIRDLAVIDNEFLDSFIENLEKTKELVKAVKIIKERTERKKD